MYTSRYLQPGDSLADAFAIRTAVFIQEQGFSADLEFDEIDSTAWHVVLYDGPHPLATGRLFPGEEDGFYVIGRVAVLPSYRGKGTGAAVIATLEKKARELGAVSITLGAQVQAEPFYGKLGYKPYGDVYMDEHCEHIHMKKPL